MVRKQTKRSSKWWPEDLRTQVLGVVTRIAGVDWSALKAVDVKLLHCTPCDPWDGYQLVQADHNLMGPPWMKDCIQVFIPLDNVRPESALQVHVGSHQVGQHESNRWVVCSMELGDILLLKGCTFHRGAGGGEKAATLCSSRLSLWSMLPPCQRCTWLANCMLFLLWLNF